MEFLHSAVWRDHDIDFARWLHPAMLHVALGSWQWIYQVAAGPPCNVTRGSGMTCHWIRPNVLHVNVNVNSRFIQRRVMMHLYYAVCAGSDEIGSFSAIEIPLLVSISAISPQSTCRSAPVCEILSKSDHSRQKKWCHVDFQYGRAPPYWILGVQ